MVLSQLSANLAQCFQKAAKALLPTDEVIEELVKDVGRVLISADINARDVKVLQNKLRAALEDAPLGVDKLKFVRQTMYEGLVTMIDSGKTPFAPKKGSPSVLMMVGLQGQGKTTSLIKLAAHYKKRGWKVAVVGADTFRAAAFAQLKQLAVKARIPFYGSERETNAARVAEDGVTLFKQDKYDLIFVDTSGRNRQDGALFDELRDINAATRPDEIIYVMDATIGQAAAAHIDTFREHVNIGSIFLSKMDSGAKGGGAASAVAALQCPISFIGTGEHIYDLQPFSPQSYVSSILGMGNVDELERRAKAAGLSDRGGAVDRIASSKKLNLMDYYELLCQIRDLGPMDQILSLLPGGNQRAFGDLAAAGDVLTKKLPIFQSMRRSELHGEVEITAARKTKIAYGAGTTVANVDALLAQHRQMQKLLKTNPAFKQMLQQGRRGGPSSPAEVAQAQKMMQNMLQQKQGARGRRR